MSIEQKPEPKRWRKIVFRVLLILPVVFLATPFVAGRFLPEDYHGSVSVVYAAPPEAVWAALNDHETTHVSGDMWKGTENLPPENDLPVWVEDMGESKFTVRTVELAEGSRLVRELADSVVPMTARMDFALEPVGEAGDRTRVVATNDITVSDGTWHVAPFRFLLTIMDGASGSVAQYMTDIGKALETEPEFE